MRSSLLYLAVQAGQKCEYLGGRCCGMVDHLPVAADFHLDILETSIDAVTDVAHLGRLKKLVTGGGDAHDRIIEQVIIVLFYLKFFAQTIGRASCRDRVCQYV